MPMTWDKFKSALLKEKVKLQDELSSKTPDVNPMVSDQSELADMFDEIETQTGIEMQLEERLKHVVAALKRIDEGSYGICKICKEKIEEKRLEANPFAETCIKHLNTEV